MDYVIPNPIYQDQQPQYDAIQLGHTQHGPAADQYETLSQETEGRDTDRNAADDGTYLTPINCCDVG